MDLNLCFSFFSSPMRNQNGIKNTKFKKIRASLHISFSLGFSRNKQIKSSQNRNPNHTKIKQLQKIFRERKIEST